MFCYNSSHSSLIFWLIHYKLYLNAYSIILSVLLKDEEMKSCMVS